jgi:ubiquitin-conjugating enzyme E2 variant
MRAQAYSELQRVLEAGAIAAWVAVTLSLASAIASDLGLDSALVVTLGLAAGFVAADFFSGLVHWLADTWGRSDWPIIGPTIIRGFREHHADPDAILVHDFIETNGSSSAGSLVLLGLAAVLPFEGQAARLADAAMLSLSTALFATNQIHKWAHSGSPPAAVAWLQERGWVLRPADHAVHHAVPFDRNYCITTGWLNPLCQRLEVFTTLERWITTSCGAIPRRHEAPPRGERIPAQ